MGEEPPASESTPEGPRPLREWSDLELRRGIEFWAAWSPHQRIAIRQEAARRGLLPTAWATIARMLRTLVHRPGSALLITGASVVPFVLWPVLVWALVGSERLTLLVGGWGAAVGGALLFPWQVAAVTALSRGHAFAPIAALPALRHAPVALASLGSAFTLMFPAGVLLFVPCVGGFVVYPVTMALLLSAGVVTGFAIERGLDPIAAWAAWRDAERRIGRAPRWALASVLALGLLLGGMAMAVVFVAGLARIDRDGDTILDALVMFLPWILLFMGYAGLLFGIGSLNVSMSGPLEAPLPAEGAKTYSPHRDRGALHRIAALVLAFPLGSPFWGTAVYPLLESGELPISAWAVWAAIPTVHLMTLAGGLLLLRFHQTQQRAVVVDDAGLLLDVGPRWGGTRVPWSRLKGYALEEDGVRLVPAGRLGRWLGPLVPARDRDAHDLLELLEKRGLERM